MRDALLFAVVVLAGIVTFLLFNGNDGLDELRAELATAKNVAVEADERAVAARVRELERRAADSTMLAVMADSVEQLQGSRQAAVREGAAARAEARRLTAELDSATAAVVEPIVNQYESRIRADSIVIVTLEGQLEIAVADARSARSLLVAADSSYAALEAAYDAERGVTALQREIMAGQSSEIRRLKLTTGAGLVTTVALGVALVVR